MTTKELVVSLVAAVAVVAILVFVLPLLLNASSSLLNAIGASAVVGLVIGVIAVFHSHMIHKIKEKK
jgi:hypothetical protein